MGAFYSVSILFLDTTNRCYQYILYLKDSIEAKQPNHVARSLLELPNHVAELRSTIATLIYHNMYRFKESQLLWVTGGISISIPSSHHP
jgi:hypothetical protein